MSSNKSIWPSDGRFRFDVILRRLFPRWQLRRHGEQLSRGDRGVFNKRLVPCLFALPRCCNDTALRSSGGFQLLLQFFCQALMTSLFWPTLRQRLKVKGFASLLRRAPPLPWFSPPSTFGLCLSAFG